VSLTRLCRSLVRRPHRRGGAQPDRRWC